MTHRMLDQQMQTISYEGNQINLPLLHRLGKSLTDGTSDISSNNSQYKTGNFSTVFDVATHTTKNDLSI